MDTLFVKLLEQLPNLAVALLVLYWQQQQNAALLAHQRQLIDKLIQMVDLAGEGDRITMVAPKDPVLPTK